MKLLSVYIEMTKVTIVACNELNSTCCVLLFVLFEFIRISFGVGERAYATVELPDNKKLAFEHVCAKLRALNLYTVFGFILNVRVNVGICDDEEEELKRFFQEGTTVAKTPLDDPTLVRNQKVK